MGVLAESLKARLALCPATEKILVLTSMQMNRPRTTRCAGELVLAPPHSTCEQSPTKSRGSDEEHTQEAWPLPSSMHVQSGVLGDSWHHR